MKSFFNDFKTFISRGNVIDLAVAVVVGTAFTNIVNSFVTNIITPPLGLLLGKVNFANLAIHLGGTVQITYGVFFQAVIDFLITAFVIFLLVRFINEIQTVAAKKKEEDAKQPAPAPADSPEVVVLKQILDQLKTERGTTAPVNAAPDAAPKTS